MINEEPLRGYEDSLSEYEGMQACTKGGGAATKVPRHTKLLTQTKALVLNFLKLPNLLSHRASLAHLSTLNVY